MPKRFTAVPAGGMCQFKVRLKNTSEVDDELVGALRKVYEAAG